ncbi:MAG: ribosome-associated translation inhibitor RaiA [Deltaproteobacteria bacterium]|nr:ribosome-associated translation inhibitor RaiA [Deltaproteobacteria bacterium]
MKLEIHFRDMHSTDGLKTHIEDQAEKIRRYITEGELIRVIVGAERHRQYCEVFWHDKTQKKDYFAKEEGDNLYAQIDVAFDKICTQIHKAHDKLVTKHHHKEPLKKASLGSRD